MIDEKTDRAFIIAFEEFSKDGPIPETKLGNKPMGKTLKKEIVRSYVGM